MKKPKLSFYFTEYGAIVIKVKIDSNEYTYLSSDLPWVRKILKSKYFSMKNFNRIKSKSRLLIKKGL